MNVRVEPPFQVLVRERRMGGGFRPVKAWVIGEGVGDLIRGAHYSYVFAAPDCEPRYTTNPDGSVLLENEGRTWCRGWDGEAADALRAVLALS